MERQLWCTPLWNYSTQLVPLHTNTSTVCMICLSTCFCAAKHSACNYSDQFVLLHTSTSIWLSTSLYASMCSASLSLYVRLRCVAPLALTKYHNSQPCGRMFSLRVHGSLSHMNYPCEPYTQPSTSDIYQLARKPIHPPLHIHASIPVPIPATLHLFTKPSKLHPSVPTLLCPSNLASLHPYSKGLADVTSKLPTLLHRPNGCPPCSFLPALRSFQLACHPSIAYKQPAYKTGASALLPQDRLT